MHETVIHLCFLLELIANTQGQRILAMRKDLPLLILCITLILSLNAKLFWPTFDEILLILFSRSRN